MLKTNIFFSKNRLIKNRQLFNFLVPQGYMQIYGERNCHMSGRYLILRISIVNNYSKQYILYISKIRYGVGRWFLIHLRIIGVSFAFFYSDIHVIFLLSRKRDFLMLKPCNVLILFFFTFKSNLDFFAKCVWGGPLEYIFITVPFYEILWGKTCKL